MCGDLCQHILCLVAATLRQSILSMEHPPLMKFFESSMTLHGYNIIISIYVCVCWQIKPGPIQYTNECHQPMVQQISYLYII